jgi:hypothetical protein
MQWCSNLVTHHRDKMPAGALCGVHEVACTLELRQNSLVAGNRLGELDFPRLQHTFTRVYGPPQAGDMTANGVKALPMNGDSPPQAIALTQAGSQPARRTHPKNRQDGKHTIQANQEKWRG